MNDRAFPDRPWVGVGVIAFRGDDVLLVRRGRAPRRGRWSLPGGAQMLGEPAEAAARRELREEAGIEVGTLTLVAVIDAITPDPDGAVRYHYTIVDYCGAWASGEACAGDDAEGVAWAAPDALDGYDLTPEVRGVIDRGRGLCAPDQKNSGSFSSP